MTNSSKKIKVLIYEPYPMGLGGNFFTQFYILTRLDLAKFSPIVMSPIPGVMHGEFRKLGIECVVIPPPGSLGSYGGAILRKNVLSRLKAVIDLLCYNFKLARFLHVRQIDVVYANCVRAEMSIGFAARLAGVPSFLYIKGELANPVIDRLSFMLATKICFQCEQNRDDKYLSLIQFCRRKISILKPGINPTVFNGIEQRDKATLCEELGIDTNYINVAIPSQLYPLKGQHLVLEALSRLVNDFPKIRLYLLGDHVIEEYRHYRLELEQIIKKYALENQVRFTGWRRDALDIVSLMDIVIHPSFSEGFPRAVLESMALGKPVIATRVGGVREAIQDNKNGFLVEPGDIDGIERRWRDLLVNPALRIQLGQAAKETVLSEYLIDRMVACLAKIWIEMAKGKI